MEKNKLDCGKKRKVAKILAAHLFQPAENYAGHFPGQG